jgi:hypothetical protein
LVSRSGLSWKLLVWWKESTQETCGISIGCKVSTIIAAYAWATAHRLAHGFRVHQAPLKSRTLSANGARMQGASNGIVRRIERLVLEAIE